MNKINQMEEPEIVSQSTQFHKYLIHFIIYYITLLQRMELRLFLACYLSRSKKLAGLFNISNNI